jgi:hypothetical protein
MTYRIELLFVGEAPEDELARARILASPAVSDAVETLSRALQAAGLAHEVVARTVRPGKRPGISGRPKLAAAE